MVLALTVIIVRNIVTFLTTVGVRISVEPIDSPVQRNSVFVRCSVIEVR